MILFLRERLRHDRRVYRMSDWLLCFVVDYSLYNNSTQTYGIREIVAPFGIFLVIWAGIKSARTLSHTPHTGVSGYLGVGREVGGDGIPPPHPQKIGIKKGVKIEKVGIPLHHTPSPPLSNSLPPLHPTLTHTPTHTHTHNTLPGAEINLYPR